MKNLAIVFFGFLAVIFGSCTSENSKEVQEKATNVIPIEFVAVDYLLDTLFNRKGVLYQNDSFYYALGMSEEMNELLDYSDSYINVCDNLLTQLLYFSDDPSIVDDSTKRMVVDLEADFSKKRSQQLTLEIPKQFRTSSLSKDLQKRSIFLTVRNRLNSGSISQIQISVCKNTEEGYKLYDFYFFIDNESLEVLRWDLLESHSPSSLSDCPICYSVR